MGPCFDDLLVNSMASSNGDNALEKGTTFTFQSWTYIADGSGGVTNHLDDHECVESNSNDQLPSNNPAPQQPTQKTLPRIPGRKKF